jgi:DNA polymerase-3 subunit alpha
VSKHVGLHTHSEGSHLDGFAKVTDIAKRAKELGQQAVAITDHGECNQHLAFQKACNAEGVKPVFGMEGYWIDDIGAAMAAKVYPKSNSHICLLAKDQQGLSNLWAWSSIAYDAKHFYYRPMADPALMREYAEGIYASDGCAMTGLGAAVRAGNDDAARQYVATLLDIFRERFYMELHTWQFMEPRTDDKIDFFGQEMTTAQANQSMADLNQAKLRLANEFGVPLVVVNDAHHAWPEDWEKKDLIWKINTSKQDQTPAGQKADHLMGDDELFFWMAKHGIGRSVVEEAIANSYDIAMSCTAEIKPMLEMPTFTKSQHDDMAAFLGAVEKGFQRKVIGGGLDVEKYYQRMEFEAKTICESNFCGYFLMVADYVGAAKSGVWKQYVEPGAAKDPMITGPGRGSAGGALVSWLLDITALDPLKYDLLFERFMAPGRKGYPDIDVDFPQSRLRGIAQYLGARYGHDHVCALGTVSRNGPKGMLKDLGKAFDIPWADRDAMRKIIEQAVEIIAAEREAADDQTGQEDVDNDLGWDEVLAEKGGDLIPYAKKYPELFGRLGELIGVARNSGKHASGWLINDKSLLGRIPLRTRNHRKPDEVVTTQFDMWEIEELGGVKFDLLGLRHLDTLSNATKLVAERHGVTLDFESFDAEMRDPAIWEPIDKGRTTGLFQIETAVSTRAAMELKPRNELDVAALLSIIRPGVKDAGETERYLKRRAGLEPVRYDHPLMEVITSETYGVLVYQEQMMRAAKDLAGYDAVEVDDLRQAIGKKIADKMAKHESKFRDGCLANPEFMDHFQLTEERSSHQKAAEKTIVKIWASLNASARYSFNKSHAVGYGLVSVWEAWLSHHYSNEYIVELMATDPDNINRYVREARRRGIPILPPDINESDQKFTIGPNGIRYGLQALRGIAESSASDLRAKRPYADFADFLKRSKANKTQVINLIKIGAFDSFEYSPSRDGEWRPSCRSRLLLQFYDHLVLTKKTSPGKVAKMDAQQRVEHCAAWFAKHRDDKDFDTEYPAFNFDDPDVIYRIEQELVGNYVTVDPMDPYLEALDAVALKDPAEIENIEVGEPMVIGGQVSKIKVITIQKEGRNKGKEMSFVTISHNETDFEVTVFNETWNQVKLLLREGDPVALTCIRDNRGAHLVSMERLDILWKEAG